jgi:hypothetical protein
MLNTYCLPCISCLACSTRIRRPISSRSLDFLLSLNFVVEIHSVSDELHSLGMTARRTPLLSNYRLPEVVEGKNVLCRCLGSSTRSPPFLVFFIVVR